MLLNSDQTPDSVKKCHHTPTVVLNDTTKQDQFKSTVDPPKPNLTQRVLRTGCPFKGHPQRPQTLFKSSEDLSNLHLYQ